MKKSIISLSFICFLSTALFAESNTSGKVFFNHSTDLSEDGINAFNMKRAYLTLDNDVSESVSYKVTYDIGNNDGGSAHTAFLKVAMVKWKTSLGNVMIGMQGMNMFKTMENTWGHRFIDKMPMDTYGYSASADLGVGLSRSFGPVYTSALVTNGGGYKNAESDEHKKISLHAVYGESKLNKKDGFNAGVSFSTEPYDVFNENREVVVDTINGFDSYRTYNFNTSIGTSVYGTFNFGKDKKVQAIRHVIRPSISYNINPGFSQYFDEYVIEGLDEEDEDETVRYTRFQGSLFGAPTENFSSSIGLSLNNVLEAKVRNPDSTKTEAKKVTLLNNLNFRTSYNLSADSLRLAPISVTGSIPLMDNKLTINFNDY